MSEERSPFQSQLMPPGGILPRAELQAVASQIRAEAAVMRRHAGRVVTLSWINVFLAAASMAALASVLFSLWSHRT